MDLNRRPWASIVLLFALWSFTPACPVLAEQRAKPKSKKVQALREFAFKSLSQAHDLLGEEKYQDALAVLDQMQSGKRLNDHEQALMWQAYAYVQSGQGLYAEAAASFEKCLATGGLSEQAEVNTRYNLGQLYLTLQSYPEAIENLLAWFAQAQNPAPSAHFVLAMAYVQNKQIDDALPHAQQAVSKSSEPKESWLQLLLALYLEKRDYAAAVPILTQLVERFPKKSYLLQLSAVHSELNQREQALAVMELAYMEGLLSKDSEYESLAQLYLHNDLPYQAGQVLEKGLADGTVAGDVDSWTLLADCWLHARERRKALEPLKRAAEASSDGNLYLRLGQVHVDEERWAPARTALAAALRKGQLKDPGNAYLLLGIANASEDRVEEARQAFLRAQEHEKTKEAAAMWLEHMNRRTHASESEVVEPGEVDVASGATETRTP